MVWSGVCVFFFLPHTGRRLLLPVKSNVVIRMDHGLMSPTLHYFLQGRSAGGVLQHRKKIMKMVETILLIPYWVFPPQRMYTRWHYFSRWSPEEGTKQIQLFIFSSEGSWTTAVQIFIQKRKLAVHKAVNIKPWPGWAYNWDISLPGLKIKKTANFVP